MRSFNLVFSGMLIAAAACAQPTVFNGGVINGASFIPGQVVSPGSLVSIFGSGMASRIVPSDTIPLSLSLAETSVFFNGEQAPLYFVSDGQINAQLPWDLLPAGQASAQVNIQVKNGGVMSAAVPFTVAAIAPGIFSIPTGAGYAVAVNFSDGSIAAPPGQIPGYPTHPAKAGDVMIMYANGIGPVGLDPNQNVPNFPMLGGASLDATRWGLTKPQLTIGGTQADVLFWGMAPQFVGVNQINFRVPAVTGNALPIQIIEGGITSTDKVLFAVQ